MIVLIVGCAPAVRRGSTSLKVPRTKVTKQYHRIEFKPLAVTSISEVSSGEIEIDIYPNPVKDILNIHFHEGKKGRVNLQLVNATGRSIRNMDVEAMEEQMQFKLEGLLSGVYILKINLQDGLSLSKKVIVE